MYRTTIYSRSEVMSTHLLTPLSLKMRQWTKMNQRTVIRSITLFIPKSIYPIYPLPYLVFKLLSCARVVLYVFLCSKNSWA